MSEDYPILGIPAIRENPFQARPLERGRSNLLVGRSEVSSSWARFLKTRNARLNLLVGERGTGRTSLMRCLSEETEKSLHLDIFPMENHMQKILHEIFAKFVGFDVPSNNQELVTRLVNVTEEMSGPLPLITIDFTNTDGKLLADVLSSLIPALERLKALVVVILSVDQRAQWSENLIERFDHLEVINSFSKEEVKQMCELRMNSVTNIAWEMPNDAIEYVYRNSGGKPSKIVRLMRDIVDYERYNPREVKFEEEPEINIQIKPQQPESETEVVIENKFELDLDYLEETPENIPVKASPEPYPPVSFGGLGGLVSRNRNNMVTDMRFDKESHEKVEIKSGESDFWHAEGMEPILVAEEEVPHEEPVFTEEFTPQPVFQEEIHSDVNKQVQEDDVKSILQLLMNAINAPQDLSVADMLAGLRRPVIGQKESNPLDIQTLRNLGRNEAVLVEVSSQREFSPSDSRLQDRLGIKRPRMSQMCNKLYRAGILSVQQKGKSRKFRITNDAKVQLVAWGMMEAEI